MKQYNVWFVVKPTGNKRCLVFEAHTAQEARNRFESMYGNTVIKVEKAKGE